MPDRVSFILALCAAASFSLQLRAQEQQDLTKRVRQLRAELLASSREDDLRLANAGYLNGHLEEIESLVQADVIQALNAGDTSNQLLERIRPMVQGDWKERVNVLRNKTPGATSRW
jgi:hypothetical protein